MLPLRQTVADSAETVIRNASSFLDKLEMNFHKTRNTAVAINFTHVCSTPVIRPQWTIDMVTGPVRIG
jgi:hypothetical protein